MRIHSENSFLPTLEARHASFTQVEKNIADFFMKNTEKMDFSTKNIARLLFVSEASLSRFAKKCGFRGYREFIYQYEKSLQDSERMGETVKAEEVLLNYRELIEKTYSLLDERQVSKIVKLLYRMPRVLVCGNGSSGLAAREMESRFMRIGVDIDSVFEPDKMRMRSVFLTKDTLVIGFSISGETQPVLYLLEQAHQRGAKTVLLTSKDDRRFDSYCDEVLLLSSLRYLSSGNLISPQFPLLLMMDIIYNEYVSANRYEKEALHDDTLRALSSKEERRTQVW